MALDGDDVVFGIYNSASALTLWKEDGGFDDPSGYIERTTRLGDIRFAGAAGSQSLLRVTLLGEVAGRCQIQIKESTDSGQTWFARSTALTELTATGLLQHQYDTQQRKAQAHAFEIVETQSGDVVDSEGLALGALRIDGNNLGRAANLPNWKRA